MTPAARKKSTDSLLEECFGVMKTKEVDYASNVDTMANFKRNAERCGLTKFQVWLIYFGKHCDSIFNAIKYHPDNPATETKAEPLRSRIIDAINYLTILQNLIDEDAATLSKVFTLPPTCSQCGDPLPLGDDYCTTCHRSEKKCKECRELFDPTDPEEPSQIYCKYCYRYLTVVKGGLLYSCKCGRLTSTDPVVYCTKCQP